MIHIETVLIPESTLLPPLAYSNTSYGEPSPLSLPPPGREIDYGTGEPTFWRLSIKTRTTKPNRVTSVCSEDSQVLETSLRVRPVAHFGVKSNVERALSKGLLTIAFADVTHDETHFLQGQSWCRGSPGNILC